MSLEKLCHPVRGERQRLKLGKWKKNDIDSSTNGSSTSKVIIYKNKALKMYMGESLFTCFASLAYAFNSLSKLLK